MRSAGRLASALRERYGRDRVLVVVNRAISRRRSASATSSGSRLDR